MTEERGGLLIQQIQEVFPDRKPISEETGRKKIIMAALWTEICLAMPAIQARGEGYDVFVVTDASGGVSIEAHDMAVRRMVQADIVPITWMAVLSEWQRDWARTERLGQLAQVLVQHGGASGAAYVWEVQLLESSRKASVR